MAKLVFVFVAALLQIAFSQYIDVDSVNVDSPSDLHDGDSAIDIQFDISFTPSMGAAALIESLSDGASTARLSIVAAVATSSSPTYSDVVNPEEVTLSTAQQSVDLTDDSTVTWSNLVVSMDTTSLDCGSGSTYTHICFLIYPPTDAVDWAGNDIDYMNSTVCAALSCKAQVDIGISASITNPDDVMIGVGGGQAVEFDVTLSSTSSSDSVVGSSNWAITTYLSTSSSGSDVVESKTPSLTSAQRTLDLSAAGSITLEGLTVTLDLEEVTCDDFSYICASIAPSTSASWKVDATGSLTLSDTYCVATVCSSAAAYKFSLLAMIFGLIASRLLES